MILITGATGNLGRSIIDFLLKEMQPEQLAALVRSPENAAPLTSRNVPLRKGDYDAYDSLLKAFQGVDQLLFISSPATGETRNRQHAQVVKAAKEAGINHIYYTSIVNPSAEASFLASPGHYRTEEQIRDTGLSHTFFRNNLYMDLLPDLTREAAESGTLSFAAGEQRAGFVLRKEIAEAIANVVLNRKHDKQVYTLSAPQAYNFFDVAVALGKAVNKIIKYVPVSTREMKTAMQQAEVPQPLIEISTSMAEAIQKEEFDCPDDTLRKLIGREPVDIETYLRQYYTS